MSDYKEVSLGFAEFVAQLIQETFDAILSSQNYQLEQYVELQSKLDMADEQYKSQFITDEMVNQKMVEYFGFKVQHNMKVDEELSDFLSDFESPKNLVYRERLTKLGYQTVVEFIEGLIIEEQRGVLRALIEGPNAPKLMVDSGEILAKLELSNIFVDKDEKEAENEGGAKRSIAELKSSVDLGLKKRMINELIDTKTGNSTLLIDKKSLGKPGFPSNQIPNLRMAVKPTKLTTESELYSQVKIKFKSV